MNTRTTRFLFAALSFVIPIVASLAVYMALNLPPQASNHVPLFGPNGGGRGLK